ncbi:hypothetical protein JOQ06_030222, partial [Pogonophryne albipinna]
TCQVEKQTLEKSQLIANRSPYKLPGCQVCSSSIRLDRAAIQRPINEALRLREWAGFPGIQGRYWLQDAVSPAEHGEEGCDSFTTATPPCGFHVVSVRRTGMQWRREELNTILPP